MKKLEMAITVITTQPDALLEEIKKYIDKKIITTWKYDSNGDFTISREQWENQAWMRPRKQGDKLVFGIVKPQQQSLTREVYGVYHGRLCATLLSHFDHMIIDMQISPLLDPTLDTY